MRIVLIGPPGAGKGTQSVRLSESLHVPRLSTGDILREAIALRSEVGQTAQKFIEQGQLVPDQLVNRVVFERLQSSDCESGCILDGYPRTVPQAQSLDNWFAEHQAPLDCALEIFVPEEELLRRLAGRGRQDDSREVVAERLHLFEDRTRPLLDHYSQHAILRRIDGTGDPADVFKRILAVVRSAKP